MNHYHLKPKEFKNQFVNYAQVKYNGHRYCFSVDGFRDGRCMGRTKELFQQYPHMRHAKCFKELCRWLPPVTALDGELYVPGQPPSAVKTTIINALDDLRFAVFALPILCAEEQFDLACDVAEYKMRVNLQLHRYENIDVVESIPIAKDVPLMTSYKEHYLNLAIKNKVEGYVLKQANYLGWYKVKPQKTIDCIITGLWPGFGKYTGQVGSLIVSAYINGRLIEVCRISGMSDEARAELSPCDIGRVCEVEYQALGAKSRLIHGHFLRFRDDKPAEECVYELSDL